MPGTIKQRIKMQYNLVSNADFKSVTVFHDGELLAADSNHPNFDRIIQGLFDDDESVVDLFDLSRQLEVVFQELSERLSIRNGRVYFDGDAVDGRLEYQILRLVEVGNNEYWKALVNFYEKIAANPNDHSREQLFEWLDERDFTILSDGNFIAYKGVRANNGGFESIHHGRAIVDGKEYNGAIPNNVGSVVEMPRSEVQFNPTVGCSNGLHVATWDYAKDWGSGTVLKISVNPRDVVSVPTECSAQKMRVCRYKILEVIDAPSTRVVDDYVKVRFDDDADPQWGDYEVDPDEYS